MPLRKTVEVIGDAAVTRFNGNSMGSSRVPEKDEKRQEQRREKIKIWQKRTAKVRAKEADYTRRYLNG